MSLFSESVEEDSNSTDELHQNNLELLNPEAVGIAPTISAPLAGHSSQSWDGSYGFSSCNQTASHTPEEMNQTVSPESLVTQSGIMFPRNIEVNYSHSTRRSVSMDARRAVGSKTYSSSEEPPRKDGTLPPNDDHPVPNFDRVEGQVDIMMPTVSRFEPSDTTSHSSNQPTFQYQSASAQSRPLNEFSMAVPSLHDDNCQNSLLVQRSCGNIGGEPPTQQLIPKVGNCAPKVNTSLTAHTPQFSLESRNLGVHETVSPEPLGAASATMSHQLLSQQTVCGITALRDSTTVPLQATSSESLTSGEVSTPIQNTDVQMVQNTAQSIQSNPQMLGQDEYLSLNENQFLCCDICPGRKFWSILSLYDHYSEKHRLERKVQCWECPKKFGTLSGLRTHEGMIHPKLVDYYRCILCPAVFSNYGEFSAHEEIHFGPRRYQCEKCLRVFTTIRACLAHEKYC